MKWSQQEAVEILGISDRHLRRLIHAGTLTKSDDGFDQPRLIAEWISYKSRPDQALLIEQVRLVKERADRQAWDNQKRRDELVSTDEAMTAWEQICKAIRKCVSDIPTKAAALCIGKTMPEIKALLDDVVREVLTEIASPEIRLIDSDDQAQTKKRARA